MPVGRAGKRGSHRPPAVPFRYSHHASRPWLHRWWQRSCEPPRSGRRRSPCDQWLEVGAALLPQSRGVVVRRRAGRWPCTASWALAGEPRSRHGDPPAAAARGAKHPPTYWHTDTKLTHGLCVCLAAAHRRRPQVRRWLTRERRQRWSDRRLCGASASARAPKKGGWTERAALGHRTALEWLQIMVSGIYDCQSTVG
jgi:hypothetical protein